MANFRYSHLFTTKIGSAATEAASSALNANEIAIAIHDGFEKIMFKNDNGEVVTFPTDEQVNSMVTGASSSITEALNAEIERATAAENVISGNVIAEETRAKAAEDVLSGKIGTEISDRKAEAVASVNYELSGETHVINFYNANNAIIDTIDASDFIKDGMIDSVTLETKSGTTYLVIVWNTDSGKERTEINIGDIFDADNYYTKAEVDTISGNLATAISAEETRASGAEQTLSGAIETEKSERESADTAILDTIEENERITAAALNDLNDRLSGATGDLEDLINTVSGNLATEIQNEASRAESAETALSGAVQSEAATREDNDIVSGSVDSGMTITLVKGDDETIVLTNPQEFVLGAGEF